MISTQAAASYCQNTFRPYLGWRLNALESLGCYAAVAACALGVLGIEDNSRYATVRAVDGLVILGVLLTASGSLAYAEYVDIQSHKATPRFLAERCRVQNYVLGFVCLLVFVVPVPIILEVTVRREYELRGGVHAPHVQALFGWSFRDLRPGRHAWMNVKKVVYALLVAVAALGEGPAIQLCTAILILAAACVEIINATSLP